MSRIFHLLVGSLSLLGFFAFTGWLLYRSIRRSVDPARLTMNWVATLVLSGIVLYTAISGVKEGPEAQVVSILAAAVCGLVMAILWAPSIGALVARPFMNLYDGGSREIEPRPFYALARTARQRGWHQEAIVEIDKQLEIFPDDFEGWMMKAEIWAVDLKELDKGVEMVESILSHEEHRPKNIAYALNQVADWQLKYRHSPEEARKALERIQQLLPDTEQYHNAAQRLAHLASTDYLEEKASGRTFSLPEQTENIGLLGRVAEAPAGESPEITAGKLVAHLQEHPLDGEARERLAMIYAEHYKRVDMAVDQLNQLIAAPHQSDRQIARWLNMSADLQVRVGNDVEGARRALQEIITRFPKGALAATAESRISRLQLETKRAQKSQAIKLGSYEQNIGLKSGQPKP